MVMTFSFIRAGLVFAAFAVLLSTRDAEAQGVTGSAVQGTVTSPDGGRVTDAQIELRNGQTVA
jgi:hypothetical protein